MVQFGSGRERFADGVWEWARGISFFAVLAGCFWVTMGVKLTTPAIAAFDEAAGSLPVLLAAGVPMLGLLGVEAYLKLRKRRRSDIASGNALERVTNQPETAREASGPPWLEAVSSLLPWPVLAVVWAPEIAQVIINGEGLKAIVAVAVGIGFVVLASLQTAVSLRRAIKADLA